VHVLLASIPTDPKTEESLAMTEAQQTQFPQWAQRNLVGKTLSVEINPVDWESSANQIKVRTLAMALFEEAPSVWFEVQAQLEQSQKEMLPQGTQIKVITGKIKLVSIIPKTPEYGMKPAIPARVLFVLTGCKLTDFSEPIKIQQ
jgi:hypothetical protein